MPERLDPRPLFSGLADGLRQRRLSGNESPDWLTRSILFGLPLCVGIAVVLMGAEFTNADALLAACALLTGALLTAFAQIASWRERILVRHRRVQDIDVRSLNEAAAHVLVGVIVSVLAAVVIFVLTNVDLHAAGDLARLTARILSGISIACLAYIAISLLIVVNLLWDALQTEQKDIERESVDDL